MSTELIFKAYNKIKESKKRRIAKNNLLPFTELAELTESSTQFPFTIRIPKKEKSPK